MDGGLFVLELKKTVKEAKNRIVITYRSLKEIAQEDRLLRNIKTANDLKKRYGFVQDLYCGDVIL